MINWSFTAGQTPLLIVHCKTFTPMPTEVSAVAGSELSAKTAEPVTTDQAPVPVEGEEAVSVVLWNKFVDLFQQKPMLVAYLLVCLAHRILADKFH